jgi:hypothetical protein
MTVPDLWEASDREHVDILRRRQGEDHVRTWNHVVADGRTIVVEVASHDLEFTGRDAVLVAVKDITAQRALEAQLTYQAFHDPLTGLPNRACSARGWSTRWPVGRPTRARSVHRPRPLQDGERQSGPRSRATSCWWPWPGACRPPCAATTPWPGWGATSSPSSPWAGRRRRAGGPAHPRGPARTLHHRRGRRVGVGQHRCGLSARGRPRTCCATPTWPCTGPSRPGATATRSSIPPPTAPTATGCGSSPIWCTPSSATSCGCSTSRWWSCVPDTVVGFEALLRWEHPEFGTISPLDFIPIAEETGIIVPVGRWVLDQACAQARRWQQAYPRSSPLTMAVNVSARQLQEASFVDEVQKALDRHRMPPDADPGDHRERPARREHGHPRPSGGAQAHRGAPGHRRLRHRVLVAVVPAPVPHRRLEDRPVLHHLIEAPGSCPLCSRGSSSSGASSAWSWWPKASRWPSSESSCKRLECLLGQGFLWAPPLESAPWTKPCCQRRPPGPADAADHRSGACR